MVRVRPTTLVGHPSRSSGFIVFRDFLAAGRTRTSNQIFKESGSSPTSLLKAALLELECLVSDKVSWSDTPTFHNTLVVGSSPTSSTTQSRHRSSLGARVPGLEFKMSSSGEASPPYCFSCEQLSPG